MADLFRLGVSLFLVDRISTDMRRVGYASRITARDIEVLDTRMAALQRVMASQQGARSATAALAQFNRETRESVVNIGAQISALEKQRLQLQAMEASAMRQYNRGGYGRIGSYGRGGNLATMGAGIALGGITAEQTGIVTAQGALIAQRDAINNQKESLTTATKQGEVEEARYATLQKQMRSEEELLALQGRRAGMEQQRRAGIGEYGILTGFALAGVGGALGSLITGPIAAAMPVEAQMKLVEVLGKMSPAQVRNMFSVSQDIAGRIGLYTGADVFNIGTSMVLGGMTPGTATGQLPATALAAEVLEKSGRGQGAEIAGSLTKLGIAWGITTGPGMHKLTEEIFSLLSRAPMGTTAPEFINRLLNIGAGVRGGGGSIEDAMRFAAFTEFAGGKAGLTPNLLFTFLTRMNTPPVGAAGAKAAVGMQRLGLRPGEDIETATLQLTKDFEKMGPQQFAAWAYLAFGGIRGMKTAESLAQMGTSAMKESWERVNQMLIEAQLNPVEAAQDKLMDNLQAQLTNLQTNLGSVSQTIGTQVNPSLIGMVKWLNTDVQAFNEWLRVHPGATAAGTVGIAGVSAGARIAGYGLMGGALAQMTGYGTLAAWLAGGGLIIGGGFALAGVAAAAYLGYSAYEKDKTLASILSTPGPWEATHSLIPHAMRDLPPAVAMHESHATAGPHAAVTVHGGVHVHIGHGLDGKSDEHTKRVVAEGVHRALYNISGAGEGVGHEWPFTSPDLVGT